jgi:hypothetical protein
MTTIMTAEHLWHAKLLRDKKQEEVLSLLEGTFADSIRWYRAFGYDEPQDIRMLWRIRDYYEQSGLSAPDDIQSVLGSLPPRPPSACAVKSQVPVEPASRANSHQPSR